MGYGENATDSVPAYSTLIFKIEVIDWQVDPFDGTEESAKVPTDEEKANKKAEAISNAKIPAVGRACKMNSTIFDSS